MPGLKRSHNLSTTRIHRAVVTFRTTIRETDKLAHLTEIITSSSQQKLIALPLESVSGRDKLEANPVSERKMSPCALGIEYSP